MIPTYSREIGHVVLMIINHFGWFFGIFLVGGITTDGPMTIPGPECRWVGWVIDIARILCLKVVQYTAYINVLNCQSYENEFARWKQSWSKEVSIRGRGDDGFGIISPINYIYIIILYTKIYIYYWLVVSNMFYFPFHIWNVILPIDELICFKMVIAPPTDMLHVVHKMWGKLRESSSHMLSAFIEDHQGRCLVVYKPH